MRLPKTSEMLTKDTTKNNRVTLKLPDGTVIEGTEETIVKICSAIGYEAPCYNSSTKGTILISSMVTQHIRNALLHEYKKWLDDLRVLSNADMLDALKKGAGVSNSVIVALAHELSIRVDNGEV